MIKVNENDIQKIKRVWKLGLYAKQRSHKYTGQILEIKRAIQGITQHELRQIYVWYGESSTSVTSRSNQPALETRPDEDEAVALLSSMKNPM